MGEQIRKCGLYCEYFADVLVEFFCSYGGRENIVWGEDCRYRLREVSKERKKEIDSGLEKHVEFQKKAGESLEKIKGPHLLRVVT